jgi:hypothetical protein
LRISCWIFHTQCSYISWCQWKSICTIFYQRNISICWSFALHFNWTSFDPKSRNSKLKVYGNDHKSMAEHEESSGLWSLEVLSTTEQELQKKLEAGSIWYSGWNNMALEG